MHLSDFQSQGEVSKNYLLLKRENNFMLCCKQELCSIMGAILPTSTDTEFH